MARTTRAKADTLQPYRDRRDFSQTSEPSGDEPTQGAGDEFSFCVQKHRASSLHFDFRIEWDGVLKSWAVAKGPSLDPRDKRLAVRTEDHPLAYGAFEGTIPAGEYGGGTVMLWDRGTWTPVGDAAEGLEKGELKMRLSGERMDGRWVLVRMKPRKGEKRENWLLVKEKDEAVDRRVNLTKAKRSIATDRTMDEIARNGESITTFVARTDAAQDQEERARAREGRTPAFARPALATLVDAPPEGDEWLHELKYDGYRILIAVGADGVRCFTRNEKDWTDRFPGIVQAAERLPCDTALIDGEVVAFDAEGGTDFSTLQKYIDDEDRPLTAFCFDLLHLDGQDLRAKGLSDRKERLRRLLRDSGMRETLLYSEHVAGSGAAVLRELCSRGEEGIVSKRADGRYAGGRSKDWQKAKCTRRQEFVIGGYAPSDKAGRPFSSILVGVQGAERLDYRGRVGTGFDEATLADLKARFDALARKTSPFSELPDSVARNARFVTPKLVAEVDYTELTGDGQIRHGAFKGLREDKAADSVVDETPDGGERDGRDADRDGAPVPEKPASGRGGSSARRSKNARASADTASGKAGSSKRRAKTSGASAGSKSGGSPSRGRAPSTVAGVRLTHASRVVFEEQGMRKGDLARYYEAVAGRMLKGAGERPLSLVRCPKGREGQCFFQKHAEKGFPDPVGSVSVREKDGTEAAYLSVDNAAGLVGCVQMGTLEFHIWGSRNDRLERPDRLVFDLDPAEGLDFGAVRDAAANLRDRLGDLGLTSFALATGGKGVHVVAPLQRYQDFDRLKAFAEGFATRLATEEPERFTANMRKEARKGRIFVDWLRNERGQTAIAPYSTRSRKGAPVATPVSWDELAGLEAADTFTPAMVLERLEEADPWADYTSLRQSVTKAVLARVQR